MTPREPTASAIARLCAFLTTVAARSRRVKTRSSYLLVTPLGMPARAWLEAELGKRDLHPKARTILRQWPRLSTAVQVRQRDPAHLRRAVLFESTWSALFPRAHALAWAFEPSLHARLVAAKTALREGVERRVVKIGPRSDDTGVLHGFHLADAGDAEHEARQLEAALNLK